MSVGGWMGNTNITWLAERRGTASWIGPTQNTDNRGRVLSGWIAITQTTMITERYKCTNQRKCVTTRRCVTGWIKATHTQSAWRRECGHTHSMDDKGNWHSWLNRTSTHTTWITVERGRAGWIGTTRTKYVREKRYSWLNGVTQSMRGWLRERLRLAEWGHIHRYGRQIGYALMNETTHTR